MTIWIVTSICIILVSITALVKVKAFFGKVFLIILGLAGLAGSYLAFDRYESMMATVVSAMSPSGSDTPGGPTAALKAESESLTADIAAKHRQLDSLNTRYEQLNKQVAAATRRLESAGRKSTDLSGTASKEVDQATTESDSGVKLGARLGESVRVSDGQFRRIDVFRGISPGDIRDISIRVRFDNRFDKLVISQEGPDGVARGNCPVVDTVYSSAFFDYQCDLLANGTGIVVTTFSEFPLMIEDIVIQPK